MGLGLFERVGPKLYRLTPYGRSAVGDVEPGATRTIHGRVSSPPADLEERLDEDARTLGHDPNNIAALNRTARRYLERGETARAIETFERVLAIDPTNMIASGRLRQLRR
jgi:tetratricopeptide (TPR) repeat protein